MVAYYLFFIFTALCWTVTSFNGYAQFQHNYIPLATHSESSTVLIKKLRQQLDREMSTLDKYEDPKLKQIYRKRTNFLIQKVKDGFFIKDDSLQSFVQDIFQKIISNNH